jgi:hypothetical protein
MMRPGVPTTMCTPRRSAELLAVALAAVDGQHVHALQVRGVRLERLAHLQRELAGRGEHERLRRLLRQVEARQDRQRERRRLARAGLRRAEHVAPRQQRRDRRRLDRRRRLVADVLQRLQDGASRPRSAKRGGGGGSATTTSALRVAVCVGGRVAISDAMAGIRPARHSLSAP